MLRKARLLLFIFVLVPCISHAEIKTFTYTVKQTFGGGQSPDNARVAGIAKAKRQVLEKAATYLDSLSIVKDSMVEKDEIFALTAGLLEAKIVSQQNFATVDVFGIIVVAKVDVYTNILEERINRLLQDRSLLEKYNESQKREKDLLSRIIELEIENEKLKMLPPKEQKQKKEILENQFRESTQSLSASELTYKTLSFWQGGKYTDPDKALEYLNNAVTLDPTYDKAYNNRGLAWHDKGNYHEAISDYNKAIELNPTYDKAYNNRGLAWGNIGNYDQAISDYNKAIELNPKNAKAYNNLAWLLVTCSKTEYRDGQKAISLAKKAIEIDPNHCRLDTLAAAYAEAGNFEMAVRTEQEAYSIHNSQEYKSLIEAYKKRWTYTEYQKRKNQ